jgi:hypothetical protein
MRARASDATAYATKALAAFADAPPVTHDELRDLHVRVASFLGCALHYALASLALSDGGFPGPATAIARTVIELDIDLAYILQNRGDRKATLSRMGRFWAVYELTMIARAQRAKTLQLPLGDRLPLAEFGKRKKEIARRYPGLTHKKWADHELERRAELTNRGPAYRWAYDFGSGALHSGAEAIRYTTTIEATPDGYASVQHEPGPRAPRMEPVCHVTVALAQIAQEVSNYLQLGYGSQCREIVEAIASALTTQARR